MSLYKHAIFDLDGTLVDSLPGIAWSIDQALAACSLPLCRRDLSSLIGPPIRSILSFVSGLPKGEELDRLERAFRTSYDSEGWAKTILFGGVREVLGSLRDCSIALWMVTNKPAFATRRILEHFQMWQFFAEVVCHDSRTPPYASKAEALDGLLRCRKLSVQECVFIGDTAEDRHAASAAGTDCVIVPHGYGGDPTFESPDWTPILTKFSTGSAAASRPLRGFPVVGATAQPTHRGNAYDRS
jgi:phosphoglycolate phosphatase